MVISGTRIKTVCGRPLLLAVPASAQFHEGHTKPFNEMPPDVLFKVESLGNILYQRLSQGELTEAEISRGVMSGQPNQKSKQLNPEADRLLHRHQRSIEAMEGTG